LISFFVMFAKVSKYLKIFNGTPSNNNILKP
jgi:hypothetical protein